MRTTPRPWLVHLSKVSLYSTSLVCFFFLSNVGGHDPFFFFFNFRMLLCLLYLLMDQVVEWGGHTDLVNPNKQWGYRTKQTVLEIFNNQLQQDLVHMQLQASCEGSRKVHFVRVCFHTGSVQVDPVEVWARVQRSHHRVWNQTGRTPAPRQPNPKSFSWTLVRSVVMETWHSDQSENKYVWKRIIQTEIISSFVSVLHLVRGHHNVGKYPSFLILTDVSSPLNAMHRVELTSWSRFSLLLYFTRTCPVFLSWQGEIF